MALVVAAALGRFRSVQWTDWAYPPFLQNYVVKPDLAAAAHERDEFNAQACVSASE